MPRAIQYINDTLTLHSVQYLANLQQQKVLKGSGSSRRTSPCAAEISMRMNIDIFYKTTWGWIKHENEYWYIKRESIDWDNANHTIHDFIIIIDRTHWYG